MKSSNTPNNEILPLFQISGKVVQGNKLGRTVEMPTANLLAYNDISHIKKGVYATTVELNNTLYYGITHIGTRPAVNDNEIDTIETYIFDFNEEIYGEELSLCAFLYIRPTINFSSLEEVKAQVEDDIKVAKNFLRNLK